MSLNQVDTPLIIKGIALLYSLWFLIALFLEGKISKSKSHRQKQREMKRQLKQAVKKQNTSQDKTTTIKKKSGVNNNNIVNKKGK